MIQEKRLLKFGVKLMNKLSNADIFALQEQLAHDHNYKALDSARSDYYRDIWAQNLPDGLKIDGSDISIYTSNGDLICTGYDRIVIGDYGAFIEFSAEQANRNIYKIKEGQEYRVNNPRYMYNVKYNWLTIADTDIKIYEQKKTVTYADYKAGKYYISPHEDLVFGYNINSKSPSKGTITLSFDAIPKHCGECSLYIENMSVDDEPMWGDGIQHFCPFGAKTFGCLVERPDDCPIITAGD